ncbi:Hypothetical protein CINCED_3A013007 [Cinara cedri]|uniref:Uncharacterized protein n=1 Tax=Cinara cedri TaxID=506608 RepID=A0A5E4MNZ6_9HEMI|nr:Hypothetical protein CINCED_3A013007 [Cinara cedri]
MSTDNNDRPTTDENLEKNPAGVGDKETPPVVVYQTTSYDADDENSCVSLPSVWRKNVQTSTVGKTKEVDQQDNAVAK